jgi:hypothetical protein
MTNRAFTETPDAAWVYGSDRACDMQDNDNTPTKAEVIHHLILEELAKQCPDNNTNGQVATI